MADNPAKKEQKKKKSQAKEDKAARAEHRRQNSDKGKNLEDMLVYVDEFGNLTSSPPDPSKRQEIDASEISIQPGRRPVQDEAELTRKGKVTYYSEAKRFGFITDSERADRIFFHDSELSQPVREGDTVSFLRERNEKGYYASNVTLI